MLFSCGEPASERDASADETTQTEYSENLSITMSRNGQRSYLFETPLVEGYTLAREPYREFRRGIVITTFLDDSLSTVDATLRANYAIYYPERELWEAKGDVSVEKYDGKKLYTQQLFWNARTRKIYSNVDSKFVHARGVSRGEGFEADEDFKDWRFRRQRSRFEVDTAPVRGDSTARTSADAPGGAPERVSGASSEAAPAARAPKPLPAPAVAAPQARPSASGDRRLATDPASRRASAEKLRTDHPVRLPSAPSDRQLLPLRRDSLI